MELAGLALPIFILLIVQVLIMALYSTFKFTYETMGKIMIQSY